MPRLIIHGCKLSEPQLTGLSFPLPTAFGISFFTLPILSLYHWTISTSLLLSFDRYMDFGLSARYYRFTVNFLRNFHNQKLDAFLPLFSWKLTYLKRNILHAYFYMCNVLNSWWFRFWENEIYLLRIYWAIHHVYWWWNLYYLFFVNILKI